MTEHGLEKIHPETHESPVPMASRVPERLQMTVQDLVNHVDFVKQVADRVMEEGVHYGTIPGTPRPSLWKPGAEQLGLAFHLVPEYSYTQTDLNDGHREYHFRCELYTRGSREFMGSGIGEATTLETKHRYRTAKRACPSCSREAIVKSKYGGWWCASFKDGCGAKFQDDDPRIVSQVTGQVENPNIADTYNSVMKQGAKRAFIAAIITTTATGDRFCQGGGEEPEDDLDLDDDGKQASGHEAQPKRGDEKQPGPKSPAGSSQALNQQKALIKKVITQLQPDGTTWQEAMDWMRGFVGVDINGLDSKKAQTVIEELDKGKNSSLVAHLTRSRE